MLGRNAYPIELDQSVMLKKHFTLSTNCGILILHCGGGVYLPLGSATAPIRLGITM